MAVKTVNAAQAAANWASAMQSATTQQKYAQGIAAVTVSPMQAAATPQAEAKYLAGVQNSISSGRRAAGLSKGSLQSWQQAATTKGAQRLSTGATASLPKMQAHFQDWAQTYNAASAAAAQANGPLAKVQAAINVMKQKAGKPTI
jgi:hypothetical protein